MQITDITAVYPRHQHHVAAPSSGRSITVAAPAGTGMFGRQYFWQIVVRVESNTGHTGFGMGGGGIAAVEVVNRHFRELLVGRNVDNIEQIQEIWDDLYFASIPYGRRGLGIMALSGVDIALWDLLGRAEQKPVFELIGGLRKERVRAYAMGVDTVWYRDLGYTAHKLPQLFTGADSDYDDIVTAVALARDTFGPIAPLMIDNYKTWNAEVTLEMAHRLAEFNVYFFEDVLTPDDVEGLATLRPLVKPVLIAGGEHEYTHYGFAELARAGALDLWQPDVNWCGGITALLKIIELASREGVPIAPHRGGEVFGLAVVAATDCEDLAEVLPGIRGVHQEELWLGQPKVEDGYLSPTDLPGFGVTLNESML